ncbi:MAG: 5-(carboxyamino)imidazole ribonucleotide synthase [Flavobacteriia bacterium]|nr:5-(carboxyamino)imidazole ribonucleotide synthase [Flavobacteriia bacterium]
MQNKWYGNSFRLGMIGGGQLGRMFIQEAINLDVQVHSLDPDNDAPCKSIATSFTVGKLTDYETLLNFGLDKDVLTVEIENVNIEALEELEKRGKKIFPQPHILKIIKDKGLQKQFYLENNIPTAPFELVENKDEIKKYISNFPYMQKLRTGGYDGKGVQPLKTELDIVNAFEMPSVLEKMIPFTKELSVIVARNEKGEIAVFPTVECEFNSEANLVEFLFSPADISIETEENAKKIAINVIEKLQMVGILAVELFLLDSGEILVNEIAPRPHNSGHQTIECNVTSQYEQHLRAILNLPMGSTTLVQSGVMINLLGEKGYEGNVIYEGLENILSMEGVKVHLYGKQITKSFRKMGHVTIANKSLDSAKKIAREVQNNLKAKA